MVDLAQNCGFCHMTISVYISMLQKVVTCRLSSITSSPGGRSSTVVDGVWEETAGGYTGDCSSSYAV